MKNNGFCFWPHGLWMLVPQPDIKPVPLAVKAWSPNHWTASEFPRMMFHYSEASVSLTSAVPSATHILSFSFSAQTTGKPNWEGNHWLKLPALARTDINSSQLHELSYKGGHLLLGRKAMMGLDSLLGSKDNTLLTKVHLVKAMFFPVVMYRCEELDHKERWALKNWCFWTVVLEKTLESPWDSKEIQPVHSKGNQSWIFIGRTDAEAEAPILWPPDAKSWLTGKDPDAGKDWRQEEKGMTEDEMVGWHHWLNGHGFGWTPGVGDGQGRLASCRS